jgi:DNA-binding NtrC family response regulator
MQPLQPKPNEVASPQLNQPTSPTILIVDDDPLMISIVTRILRGHHLYSAESIEEALEVLKNAPIDVVISDCHMPGGNGITFLETVRRSHPGVRRVLMSGDPLLSIKDLTQSGVVHQFVSKPVQLTGLLDIVLEATRLKEGSDDRLRQGRRRWETDRSL